jgi:DNA-binding SARP family transcriptional activator/tetratricopeptide (TPR) repeat protein
MPPSTEDPRTTIRLCGAFALVVDGRDHTADLPPGQARDLLAYLVAHRERSADRDELVDVLWPQERPKDPRADLRPILSRLRRVLGAEAVAGRDQLHLVLPEPVRVDIEEAERAVAAAREAAAAQDWEAVRDHAALARERLAPELLPGRDAPWLETRRRALEDVRLEALEWSARGGIALGGAALPAAERAAQELMERAPFRESGHRLRMEALAADGNVAEALRVYDDLRRLLRDELGVAPAPEVQALHGRLLAGERNAPAPAAAPAPRDRVTLPRGLSPRERTPCIGREPELSALRELWTAARSGRRGLVVLSGDPGVGKTRLTAELARDVHPGATVLYAACQADALVSYQPFVDALRHYLRDRPPPADVGPGIAQLAPLIPELVVPADGRDPPPDDPQTRRYLLFDGVSELLAGASAATPLLLVLDDLHWADRPTLQLLAHVARAPHEARLLILGTYRRSDVGPGHPLAELLADLRRDRFVESLALAGLDERGVGALIAEQAGHEAPAALVRVIHEATDGNPFFVEEVLRDLIGTGVLFEREGRWASTLGADEIGVPEGVEAVLARRLAALSEACRTTLAQASVLGREFAFDTLSRMAGAEEDTVIGALEEALAAQLVVEAPRRAAPTYAFTHALVREALYGGLSAPRRQRLHALAARAIGPPGDDADVAALATHHRLAGAQGEPAVAIDCSLRAGERARTLFAWDEAARHWDGALTVMERIGAPPAHRARLAIALADLMVVVGDLGRQIAYLERALELSDALGDEERAAQVHSRLGMAHSLIDSIAADHLDIGEAFAHYDAARPVLERGPVRRARGHLEIGVSTALTYGLRIGDGIEAAQRALDIAEQLGDEALHVGAAEAYGWHAIVAGDLREGFDALERAFDTAAQSGAFLAWMARNIAGQLTWGLGDPDGAQAAFERPLVHVADTAYRQQVADGVGRCHASRGELGEARRLLSDAKPTWITHSLQPLLDLWDGEWDQVDALARRTLATSRRTGNRWDEWASHHLAARVAALRGHGDEAQARLEAALAIVVDGGARYFELWVRPDLARLRAHAGDHDGALQQLARCREVIGNGEDWRGRVGHVGLAEAVAAACAGRFDAADARFAAAVDTLRRYRLLGDEAEALHRWGVALAEAGDRAGAVARLQEALDLYRRHGAGPPWRAPIEAQLRRLS